MRDSQNKTRALHTRPLLRTKTHFLHPKTGLHLSWHEFIGYTSRRIWLVWWDLAVFFGNQVQSLKQNTTKTTKKFDIYLFFGYRPHFFKRKLLGMMCHFFLLQLFGTLNMSPAVFLGLRFRKTKDAKVDMFLQVLFCGSWWVCRIGANQST